jgi:hypothetical protein
MVTAAIDLACAQADLGHNVAFCSGPGDFDDILEEHHVKLFGLKEVVTVGSAATSIFRIFKTVSEFRPDVIHTHMTKVSLLMLPIAKLMKIPFVTCVHNSSYNHAFLMGVGDLVITGCEAEVEMMRSSRLLKNSAAIANEA